MPNLRIVHSEAATSFGGQEGRIFKEMTAMRARGHHMEAICQPKAQLAERLSDAGFPVHTLEMDGAVNYLKGIATIRGILREGRFDVLNTHSRRDTVIAAAAGRLAGTPLIVRTRHLSNKVGSLWSYTCLPHRVTTVSDHVRQHLIDRGVPASKVATVYSPIVLPPPVERSTLREELGLADDDIVVGCVAVMRATKGHKDLIDAVAPLMASRPKLHLVFVGGGSPVFEQTQAYVAELGLQDRIHLMGMRRDVPNLLAGFDLFALATQQEASGTVYVEAQASGLPVIGTDVGGVSEMFRDGETGILVPPKDPEALSAALVRLIDDAGLRQRMGEAGRKMVWDEGVFSPARLAETTEAVYAKWLAERAG
ncbi:glycosyltransferase family 4 protein [Achromobacter insolitus]|jgi:glycosyltransferase involved in cell wall biosynthesis|uniref:glycosyltransferase family 4 protein n=1 Tax=Achromobacter TaxID=222 RepID=UPI0005372155|nr:MULTISPECIES: glycosyltransferase family 4 protein [Achromobacter]GLK97936.1 glycosyl transferase [Achromobacter xylosoxidans]APX73583.1 glycosyltransferase family 1 protein [Achromobacter insolitus]AVG38310.1 glycosyltransferase family 1 protein [Achromobacter insolitus]AXA72123.1 glycosyltransferase family 1 protein [Achromobacter insolitus]MCP1404490.1 glycosyltransferase involved in cell wall biosynthesis [Achromobacter insolitus]